MRKLHVGYESRKVVIQNNGHSASGNPGGLKADAPCRRSSPFAWQLSPRSLSRPGSRCAFRRPILNLRTDNSRSSSYSSSNRWWHSVSWRKHCALYSKVLVIRLKRYGCLFRPLNPFWTGDGSSCAFLVEHMFDQSQCASRQLVDIWLHSSLNPVYWTPIPKLEKWCHWEIMVALSLLDSFT